MDQHRYQQIKRLFHEAAEVDGDARQQFLDEACGDDAELAREMNRLFGEDALHDESILERPAVDAAQLREALWDIATENETHPLPKSIGGYQVTARLGRGGMGVVYEAQQLQPKRQVAVKLMHPGLVSPASIRRFQREAHILGQLQHPGIVQVFEASTATVEFEDGSRSTQPYVVMEMVRAEPLHKASVDLQLTPREKLMLITQVCDAVQYAHQRGVVHRDLKPGNILVARSPGPSESGSLRVFQTKILDFGVARLEGRETLATSFATDAGQIIGTLAYMSPEQAGGDPTLVDTRSDVYSIGVILYELLAGRPPFDIRTPSIVTAARILQQEDPPSLGTIDTRLRGDVSTIVAKAMEKDVTRRYQTAAELGADIRHHLRNEPILARPPTASYLFKKFARRHRTLVAGASATLLALVFGLIGVSWFAIQADLSRRQADERSRQLNGELYASRVQQIQRIIETDGVDPVRSLLSECDPPLRGWEWHRLNWLADRSRTTFRAHDAKTTNVQFSPDGTLLLSSADDGRVRLRDASTLELLHEFRLPRIRCWAQFSADGSQVVAASNAGKVVVLDVSTWTLSWEHQFDEVRVEGAAVDPSSNRVAVGWWNAGVATEIWDTHSGTRLFTLDAHAARGGSLRFSRDGTRLLVGSLDGEVSVVRADDGALLFHEQGAKVVGLNADFSRDESRVASIGSDGRLTIRDAVSGSRILAFDTRKGLSRALAFHPNGKMIAIGSIDGVVTLFDIEDGARIDALRGHESEIMGVAFRPDGRTLATSAADGTIKIWDLSVTDTVRVGQSYLTAGCASFDGRSVYFGGYHEGLVRWSLGSGLIEKGGGPMPHVGAVTTSADGRFEAAWISDGAWENPRGAIVLLDPDMHVLHSWSTNRAWRPEFSEDGERVLTRDDAGIVSVRSTESGETLTSLANQDDQIECAIFAQGTANVLTGHRSGEVGVWNATTGARVAGFAAHGKPLTQMALARAGDRLVTRADGDALRVWDWKQQRLTATVENIGNILCLAILPDGTRLATGGTDGNVRLWDLVTGRELLKVGRHLQHVLSVSFSADGRVLTSTSRDHTLHLWEIGAPDHSEP